MAVTTYNTSLPASERYRNGCYKLAKCIVLIELSILDILNNSWTIFIEVI